MGYNFPNTPADGEVFAPVGGPSWRFNGQVWLQVDEDVGMVEEAPVNNQSYARKNAGWEFIPPPGTVDWGSITSKPATFPPTLPIPSSGVTGLDAALAGKVDTADADTALVTATGGSTRTLADWMSIFETDPGNIGLDGVRTEGYAAGATKNINFGGAPISPTTSWLWGRQFVTGAPLPSSGGIMSPNTLVVNDTSTPTDPYAMSAMYVAHRVGVGATGTHQAFMADMGVTGGNATTSYSAYVAAVSASYASANVGGDGTWTTDPNTGYVGGLFGGNDNARLGAGATNWFSVIGREINTVIQTGASAFARIGLLFATSSIAGAQAVGDDTAIAISNSQVVPPVPWKKGIQFGTSWGLWAFGSASTLIGTQKRLYGVPETVIDAGYGIDFNDVTFANFAFRSPGFSVDPDGDIVGKSITVGGSDLTTGLAGKEPTIAIGTTAQYWRGDKSWQTLDKAAVGLANVDNTSDANKPVSTAQATANALAVLKAGSAMTGALDMGALGTAANNSIIFGQASTGIYGTTGLVSINIGGTNKQNIFSTGITFSIATNHMASSAMPAGGLLATRIGLTNVANFGIFPGSGAPTLSAAKGSLYMRSDGASGSYTYVNTDGATAWAPLTNDAVLKAGDTMTGTLVLPAATTSIASLNIPIGVAPTTPVDGDIWYTTNQLWVRGGANYALATLNGAQTFTAAKSFGAATKFMNLLATPAGGTTGSGITFGTTTNLGVFFGSGAPTLSAAKGSLYLRSDGTGTNTRIYVNTDGTTGWAAMSVIATGTSAPSSPATNDVWIDTT